MTFDDLLDALPHNNSSIDREFIEAVATKFGAKLVHNELGNYDESRDGFHVYELEDGRNIRVEFCEDSYSGGFYAGYSFVKSVRKTITVWE